MAFTPNLCTAKVAAGIMGVMSTPAISACGERVLALIGWAVVVVVTLPTVLLWALLLWSLWEDRADFVTTAGSMVFMAAFAVSVPVLLASVLRWQAWRSPNAMAAYTLAMFVLGLVFFGWTAALAAIFA